MKFEFLFAVNNMGKIQMEVEKNNYYNMKYIGFMEDRINNCLTDGYLDIRIPDDVDFKDLRYDWDENLRSRYDIRSISFVLDYDLDDNSGDVVPILKSGLLFESIGLRMLKETRKKLYELKDIFQEKNIMIYDFRHISEICKELKKDNVKRKLLGLPIIEKVEKGCFELDGEYILKIINYDSSYLLVEKLEPYFKGRVEGFKAITSYNTNKAECLMTIEPSKTVTLAEALEYMDEQIFDYQSIVGYQ